MNLIHKRKQTKKGDRYYCRIKYVLPGDSVSSKKDLQTIP